MPNTSYNSHLLCLCLLAQSAAGESIQNSYDCAAADGSTRQIESETYCADEQPPPGQDACRVDYTKDGNTEILWRARNDPSYCGPKLRNLISELEASGFSCTVSGGPLCDQDIAAVESSPPIAKTSNGDRGRISITPSTSSNNRPQANEIKRVSGFDGPVSVRDYLTFTRDVRYGYFLAVVDTRLGLSRADAASRSSSEEDADPLEICVRNMDLNVTFEKLENFIRRQFNSQSSSGRVVENIHVFLDDECGLETAPDLDAMEIDQ